MDSSLIRSLYAYNSWANERLLATARALPAQELAAKRHASFGSIGAVLLHMVNAQRVWLARISGEAPLARLADSQAGDFDAIYAAWRQTDEAIHGVVDQLSDEALAAALHYRNAAGKPNAYFCWQILVHLLAHDAQHRSELALLLTELGHSTGLLDYLIFLDETGQNQANSES
ncbi:MAG TPA: DinB family protein [Caldilineaceae bacterium]|nr:DinB family protein [Caldilineaceae bacterium]